MFTTSSIQKGVGTGTGAGAEWGAEESIISPPRVRSCDPHSDLLRRSSRRHQGSYPLYSSDGGSRPHSRCPSTDWNSAGGAAFLSSAIQSGEVQEHGEQDSWEGKSGVGVGIGLGSSTSLYNHNPLPSGGSGHRTSSSFSYPSQSFIQPTQSSEQQQQQQQLFSPSIVNTSTTSMMSTTGMAISQRPVSLPPSSSSSSSTATATSMKNQFFQQCPAEITESLSEQIEKAYHTWTEEKIEQGQYQPIVLLADKATQGGILLHTIVQMQCSEVWSCCLEGRECSQVVRALYSVYADRYV